MRMTRKALEQVIDNHVTWIRDGAAEPVVDDGRGSDREEVAQGEKVITLLETLPALLYGAQALDARVMSAAIGLVEALDSQLFGFEVAQLEAAIEAWRGQRVPREHPPVSHAVLQELHGNDGLVQEWQSVGMPWGECQTCGQPAMGASVGADTEAAERVRKAARCTNCYELEGRLQDYLKSHKGRVLLEEALLIAKGMTPTNNPYDPCPDCKEFIMTCGHLPAVKVDVPDAEWSEVVVRDLLVKLDAVVGRSVSLAEVQGWSSGTLAEVGRWATAVGFSSDGIEVEVPDKPEVIS